jgi:hypothetical protein
MSSRTCDLLALALLLAGLGCGSGDRRTIDICGRGDRSELSTALAGGELVVEVLDDDGDVVSRGEAPAGDAQTIDLDFAGGQRVRVSGRDADGDEVAIGEAELAGGGACVCLALSQQAAAACGGLDCVVEGGQCAFVDGETGDPAGVRTVPLDVARDTLLVAAAPDDPHGSDGSLPVERAQSVALFWFDLEQLPASAIIDGAELELSWDPPEPGRPPRPLSIHRALEPWTDDATWNQRSAGEDWTAAGCGAGACDDAPLARMATDGVATTRAVPLGPSIADWLDPQTNNGLAVRSEGNPTALRADAARLLVSFHLPDDGLPDPQPAAICGNGLLEEDEECDDGDTDDDDACTRCRIATCGDGVVRTGVEECDHGGAPDDSCTSQCLVCADPQASSTFVRSGHCYNLYVDPIIRHYGGAEEYCDQQAHGQLASLRGSGETAEVIAGLQVPSGMPLWIGLSDTIEEGVWLWASGYAPGSFDNWAATEPSDGPGEDCVVLLDGKWHDNVCSLDRGFICERQAWIAGQGGSAYRSIRRLDTWQDAELVCEEAGAHLATLTSAAEADTLSASLPPVGTDAFIGLGELLSDGALAWVTGEAVDYTKFPAAPDLDGDQFCAYLDPTGWLVTGCSRLRRFVCESD